VQKYDHVLLDGVGRMGAGMRKRWLAGGIQVTSFDLNPLVSDVASLEELVDQMPAGQRLVWLMLPYPAYDPTLDRLSELLTDGDMVVDGGNTRPTDTRERAQRFARIGVHYVDVGTSGGIWGETNGYALMVGGTAEEYDALLPVLWALTPAEDGLVHAGPSGAGHFAKMVHNGIEYAQMAAYGEGFAVLVGELGIDPAIQVLKSWRRGSVIASWLLELAVRALNDQAAFDEVGDEVPDSGEGRWTAHEIIDHGVPAPVLLAALTARFQSQTHDSIGNRLVSAMRAQFGGHAVVARKH
jgi:6-phosphogluconate dehydrogenase